MLKSTVAVGFVFATLSVRPRARAAGLHFAFIPASSFAHRFMGMTDASKKEMATKEMSMAKESMAKKDDKDCVMHMQQI